MPIVETFSSTEPARVVVAQDGPVAHVWMRRSIEKDVKEPEREGEEPYGFWHAEELHFTVAGSPTAEEVEGRFEELWDAHLAAEKTDSKRIAELAAADADSQDALAELGDLVAGKGGEQ